MSETVHAEAAGRVVEVRDHFVLAFGTSPDGDWVRFEDIVKVSMSERAEVWGSWVEVGGQRGGGLGAERSGGRGQSG